MKNLKIPPNIFAYGLIALIIIWIVYLLLRRTGLIRDKEARETDKTQAKEKEDIRIQNKLLEDSEYFNPNIYRNSSSGLTVFLTKESAENYANEIKDSWGLLNDNEERIYNIFRRIKNKYSISQVSDAYSNLFSVDLLADLLYRLSDKEIAFIYRIIDKKPVK